jgi:undecaprenyl-diphosphatase
LIEPNISETLQSFPSGHALFYFALAFVIYTKSKKWGMWFFLGAFLMGLGRVASGVHFPIDILGGAVLGILTAYILSRFYMVKMTRKILDISTILINKFLK